MLLWHHNEIILFWCQNESTSVWQQRFLVLYIFSRWWNRFVITGHIRYIPLYKLSRIDIGCLLKAWSNISINGLILGHISYMPFNILFYMLTIFSVNYSCVSEEELKLLVGVIIKAYSQGIIPSNTSDDGLNWDLANSIFFSSTVITTIGRYIFFTNLGIFYRCADGYLLQNTLLCIIIC